MKYYLKFEFQWAKKAVVFQDFRTQTVTFVRPFGQIEEKGMKPWNIILLLDTQRSVLRNLGGIFYNKRQYLYVNEKNWQWYLETSTYTEYLSEKIAPIRICSKTMFWPKQKQKKSSWGAEMTVLMFRKHVMFDVTCYDNVTSTWLPC